MKEHKKINVSGITIISLVITIIVLLILAGISINMVTGNNGIIKQAEQAKEQTDSIGIINRIKQAYHTVLLKKDEEYTKEQLMTALQKEFETNYDVDDSDNKNWILKAYGQEFVIPAGKNENTFAKIIKPENYGDAIDYTANGISDWKVFYSDGKNVYIITSNTVPNNKIDVESMSSRGMIIRRGYYNDIYGNWSNDYHYGADFADQLSNTNNWTNFTNGISGGKTIYNCKATGGPTLDMWIASWNAKGYTKIYSKKVIKQRNDEYEHNNDYDAYYVGTSDNPDTYRIENIDEIGNQDSLYYPAQECYWLTSASATRYQNSYSNYDDTVMMAGEYWNNNERKYGITHDKYVWTYVNMDTDMYEGLPVRVVVCLPADIIGSIDNLSGKWVLE